MTLAQLARLRSSAIVAAAVILAVPLGVVAATEARFFGFAAAGAAAIATATVWWFRRDPVLVLLALWAFQIIRTPLAAATDSVPFAGTILNQLTDVALLVILLSLAWDAVNPRAPRRDLRYFWLVVGLAACGLAGSVLQGAPIEPTLAGLWLGTKLWLIVAVSVAVAWRAGDADRVLRVIVGFGIVTAVLGLIDAATAGAVADAVRSNVNVTPVGTYRSNAAQSLYAGPNAFSVAMSLLVAIWLARIVTVDRARVRDVALLGLFILAALVSLRLKAVLSVAAVLAIVAVALTWRQPRRAVGTLAAGAVVVTLILLVMGDVVERQFTAYSSSGPTARSQLYDTGVRIAGDRFPLGVGFGRFASGPSAEHYSDVYDEYEISGTWGLSRNYPRFITDTSWPAVLGEAGVAGMLVYIAGLLALLGTAIAMLGRTRGRDAFAPLALVGVIAVLIVDSVGSATLFAWNTTITLGLVAGAALAQQRAAEAAVVRRSAAGRQAGRVAARSRRRRVAEVGGG